MCILHHSHMVPQDGIGMEKNVQCVNDDSEDEYKGRPMSLYAYLYLLYFIYNHQYANIHYAFYIQIEHTIEHTVVRQLKVLTLLREDKVALDPSFDGPRHYLVHKKLNIKH